MSDRRSVLRGVSAVFLGGALVGGLVRFGAVETETLCRLFGLLLVPALLALLSVSWKRLAAIRLLPLMGVGAVLLAQVALRPSLEGRGYLVATLGWLTLFLTLGLVSESRPLTRALFMLLILIGALEAVYGLIQAIGGVDYIGDYFRGSGRQATGTLINRNHFAGLLNMILPLAVGGLYAGFAHRQGASGRRSELYARSWIILLSSAFIGLAVVLSRSRGGVVSLVVTLLFTAVLLTLARRRRGGEGLPGLAVWILLLAVLGLGLSFGIDALLARVGMIDVEGRPAVYRDTLELIRDHPLRGIGPGMYRWRFRPYQSLSAEVRFDHAHNDYLETAAEWGIPVALAFWGFVGRRLYCAARTFFRSRVPPEGDKWGDPWRRGMALGCSAAIFSILVHSLVDFNLQIPGNLMLFCVILGLAWSFDEGGTRPSSAPLRTVAVLGMRLLLPLLLVAAGWRVFHQLTALVISGSAPNIAGFEEALRTDPTDPEHSFRLGLGYRDALGSRDLARARSHLERAVALNPHSWKYRLELARACELSDLGDEAEKSLLAAVELNPRSATYRWRLAHFYVRSGELDLVFPQIETALALDRSLVEAGLELLLRIGAGEEQILRAWPREREASRRALVFLVSRRASPGVETPFIEARWQVLLDDPEPPTLSEGAFYVDYLLRQGHFAETRRQWIALARKNDIVDPAYAENRSRVWNGDFEGEISGSRLGWKIARRGAFTAARAPGEGVDGGTALRIDFEGTENLDFRGVQQQVLVLPERVYELSLRARSGEITTEEGLYFQVLEPGGRQVLATEPILGTTPWRRYSATFRVPAQSHRLILRLRRKPSRRIDNRLRGSLWLDS
ncbi:MAG: tetratricopeptide repeat protein, partial [bacterium]|nr:tetratricopeptide repeat protein [bacterium]